MDKKQRINLESWLSDASGNVFQARVQSILRAVYDNVWVPPEYREDGGCDAYVPSERTIFQVYGPTGTVTEDEACAKMRVDAGKILQHWLSINVNVEEFVFILNVPETPFKLQRAATNVLAGIRGMAHGRNHLLALIGNRLTPSQVDNKLGFPRFHIEQDRGRVSSFLAMMDRHCRQVSNLWSNWGFFAAAYDAVSQGMIDEEIAAQQDRFISLDQDIVDVQVQLLNAVRGILSTVAEFKDVHTDREVAPGTSEHLIKCKPAAPFDSDMRRRLLQFDVAVRPIKMQLRAHHEFLVSYANEVPPVLRGAPLISRSTWNSR